MTFQVPDALRELIALGQAPPAKRHVEKIGFCFGIVAFSSALFHRIRMRQALGGTLVKALQHGVALHARYYQYRLLAAAPK